MQFGIDGFKGSHRFSSCGVLDSRKHCTTAGYAEAFVFNFAAAYFRVHSMHFVLFFVYIIADAGANLNVRDVNGDTPLHLACQQGSVETAEHLCALGANVHLHDTSKATALFRACFSGNIRIVECLLAKGAKADERENYGRSVLHFSAYWGHIALVSLFIAKGIQVDCVDANNVRPLQLAAGGGHVGAMQSLLGAKASPNAADVNGTTALHAAAQVTASHANDIPVIFVHIPYRSACSLFLLLL